MAERPVKSGVARAASILALLQRHARGLSTTDIAAQIGGIPNYEVQGVLLEL